MPDVEKRMRVHRFTIADDAEVMFDYMYSGSNLLNVVYTMEQPVWYRIGVGFLWESPGGYILETFDTVSQAKKWLNDQFELTHNTHNVFVCAAAQLNATVWNYCHGIHNVMYTSGRTESINAAFRNCENLEEAVFSTNVESITSRSFQNCTSLEKIEFRYVGNGPVASQLETIGEYAFAQCESLESFEFSPYITLIDDYAFQNCTALKEISLNSPAVIDQYAFQGCTGIETAELSSASSIKTSAFQGCTALREVQLGTCTLQGYIFQDCSSLETVELGRVSSVPAGTFKGCSSLQQITIPDSVTSMGTDCFSDCSKLKDVHFETHETPFGDKCRSDSVGDYKNAVMLSSFYMPDTEADRVKITSNAFSGCTNLHQITFGFPYTKMTNAYGAPWHTPARPVTVTWTDRSRTWE